MATKSFLDKVALTKEEEIEKFNKILDAESPCKDVQPVSDEQMKKGKEFAKIWLSSR